MQDLTTTLEGGQEYATWTHNIDRRLPQRPVLLMQTLHPEFVGLQLGPENAILLLQTVYPLLPLLPCDRGGWHRRGLHGGPVSDRGRIALASTVGHVYTSGNRRKTPARLSPPAPLHQQQRGKKRGLCFLCCIVFIYCYCSKIIKNNDLVGCWWCVAGDDRAPHHQHRGKNAGCAFYCTTFIYY